MTIEYAIDERALVADICRESFWEFVREFWDTIVTEPLIENWHMPYLCEELQQVAEKVFRREPYDYNLLVNISPGTSKSTIVSIMFPVWMWTREPWVQTIVGSYSGTLSVNYLGARSRSLMMSEKFQETFPEIQMSERQYSKTLFQNTKGGWRFATSTGAGITGYHAHVIIIDDPVDPQRSESEADLRTANTWITDTLPSRKVQKQNTPTIMIMQRLSDGDPAGEWLQLHEKGRDKDTFPLRHICLPAELTPDVKPPKLRKHYVDGLMDPVRLDRRTLEKAELVSAYAYGGQYLQSPIPRGGGMFDVSKIEIVDLRPDPQWRWVRYWDKAGTADGGAYTVGAKLGQMRDERYIVGDIVRGQWEASKRESIIRQTAETDGVDVPVWVEQEPGSGGKESAQNTIRNLAGYVAKADLVGGSSGNKERRADPFAAQVNGGNVVLLKGEWNRAYLDELANFPRSRYKDQVDASSGAFNKIARPLIEVGAIELK